MDRSLAHKHLHVVTGKGGTGKTSVAAALALALAADGRTTLLCEVEGRQGIAQVFDTAPLPYTETQIASAPGGGRVFALAVDPKEALRDYLQLFYRLGPAMGMLDRVGAVDFVTTIAPGLRDVLLTGKVYEATGARRKGRQRYDAVIVDAVPTGRVGRFLNVNAEVSGLARVGPVHKQADSIMRLLRSEATAVHLVTLLEEMPVQESIDAIAELHALGLPVGAVAVNRVRNSPLSQVDLRAAATGKMKADQISQGLAAAGLDHPSHPEASTATALINEAAELSERITLQQAQRQRLEETGQPLIDLPEVQAPGTVAAVHELAETIRAGLR